MLLAAMALLAASGCSDNRDADAHTWAAASADSSSQVIAVDVTGQGTVKLTSLPQGITAFSAAESPRVVLLGADFVHLHGTVPGGGRLPQLPIQQQGKPQPIVAMVDGPADAFMGQAPLTEWLPELQLIEGSLQRFQHRTDSRRRDALIPYLYKRAAGGPDGGAPQVKTAVLKGRETALLLNAEELELLACLDGQPMVYGGRTLSCRSEWSSNGDLKAPRIHTDVTITLMRDDPLLRSREASEAALARGMDELLGNLQLQGADPLDIGQTVRSMYRGVWTQERWRQAFTHADIEVRLHLTS